MGNRSSDTSGPKRDGVVLIHGLARTTGSMWILEQRIRAHGFMTAKLGYASRRLTLEQAVDRLEEKFRKAVEGWRTIHLVGHSLGGVISVRLIERCSDLPIGRVVQLGSPNAGSGVADTLLESGFGERVFGPMLGDIAELEPSDEPRPSVGAIAGQLRLSRPGEAAGLDGPNDGLVEVQSALAGAGHQRVVSVLHGFLPLSASVSREIIRFLKDGQFRESQ